MKTELVLTFLADDRPGLVAQLAATIRAHGGNWLESRMIHLAGKFAGIARAEVPEAQSSALIAALRELGGLRLTVESTAPVPTTTLDTPWARLETLAQDQPGIVSEIFGVLSNESVNVAELTTERFTAPMSAELLFKASARLQLPDGLKLAALHKALETIAYNLTAELHLEPDA